MDSRILHYEFVTGESVNITVSAEIARVQHADRTTVRESIQAARKKFKKYF